MNGLLLGGILALLSVGLNLIFGVIDVVWICYAEIIMVGMYLIFYLNNDLGFKMPGLVSNSNWTTGGSILSDSQVAGGLLGERNII